MLKLLNYIETLFAGRKKRLAMLDLLLSAQQNGLIDNEGIEEEVNTFTFEVSLSQLNDNSFYI